MEPFVRDKTFKILQIASPELISPDLLVIYTGSNGRIKFCSDLNFQINEIHLALSRLARYKIKDNPVISLTCINFQDCVIKRQRSSRSISAPPSSK